MDAQAGKLKPREAGKMRFRIICGMKNTAKAANYKFFSDLSTVCGKVILLPLEMGIDTPFTNT